MSRKRHKIPVTKEAGIIIRQVRPGYYLIDCRRQDMAIRKGFRDLESAKQYCRLKAAEIKRKGTEAAALPDELRWDALEASQMLGSVTLVEAARFFVRHHKPASGARTVAQLIKEHIAWLRLTKERRPQTIRERSYRLKAFAAAFGESPVQHVTRHDIESWIEGRGWKKLNRRHYIAAVHALFGYARKQGLVEVNPAADVEKPSYTPHQATIMSPADIQSLLENAQKDEPLIVAPLVLSFFCGLRPEEVMKLTWKDVDFDEQFIRIGASIAKMRRQRHVEMAANVMEWLMPYRKPAGPICTIAYPTYRARLTKLAKDASITIPYNAGRHAFASYHFALHAPEETAKQLGHSRTDLVVTTYRGVVNKKSAEAFWRIAPRVDTQALKLPGAATAQGVAQSRSDSSDGHQRGDG